MRSRLFEPGLLQRQSLKIALEFHSREVKAMFHHMRRRKFLVESSRAALSFSLLPLGARVEGTQMAAGLRYGAPWGTLIADLEKQIPKLM